MGWCLRLSASLIAVTGGLLYVNFGLFFYDVNHKTSLASFFGYSLVTTFLLLIGALCNSNLILTIYSLLDFIRSILYLVVAGILIYFSIENPFAVIEWLFDLEGLHQVVDDHGFQEKGKQVVFYAILALQGLMVLDCILIFCKLYLVKCMTRDNIRAVAAKRNQKNKVLKENP